MIAVIKTGAKQYKVKKGDKIKVEKLDIQENEEVTFDEVLLVGDENGQNVKVGDPVVKGAKVKAKVLAQGKNKKITIIKHKPKKRYMKKMGHRQQYTEVEITEIVG